MTEGIHGRKAFLDTYIRLLQIELLVAFGGGRVKGAALLTRVQPVAHLEGSWCCSSSPCKWTQRTVRSAPKASVCSLAPFSSLLLTT